MLQNCLYGTCSAIRDAGYEPVGYVDDNPRREGQEIHGVRVLGPIANLGTVCAKYDVELIIIAIARANAPTMRRIIAECEAAKIEFRTIPALDDIVAGDVSISDLREVRIDDLLGREQVDLDLDRIAACIAGKSVLVTGGGGSIGSELCRQIAQLGARQLTIVDQSEFNLYQITEQLTELRSNLSVVSKLVDVTNYEALFNVCREVQPELIFHSAAYKHVPMLENQARAAVINNVIGTINASRVADAINASAIVLISTDKAVEPTCVMGRTKRLAELVFAARNRKSAVPHISVRFGNVLDSAGSVVPLFRQQIQERRPGDRNASRNDAVFHDYSGSCTTHHSGAKFRGRRRSVRT